MSYARSCRNSSSSSSSRRFVKTPMTATPFCKVCYDAGLPTEEFTSHFVKDQPGPSGKVVCPTLLAQKCLICGVPGHTSSYCPDNSSTSSSSSTVRYTSHFTPALATDEIRYPSHSTRLPPVYEKPREKNNCTSNRPVPRIVYDSPASKSHPKIEKNDFPSLPNITTLHRFENVEPKLKRNGPTIEASPVHSPVLTKVKYNKHNNQFGILHTNCDDSSESDNEFPPATSSTTDVTKKSNNQQQKTSWSSIAAGNKVTTDYHHQRLSKQSQQNQQQQRSRSRFSIVIPTAISGGGPLLPPISFRPKPTTVSEAEKNKQVKKKLWGDTDSEDDEEFLKRGLE